MLIAELALLVLCLCLVGACAWFLLNALKQHGELILRLDKVESLLRSKGFYSQPPGADLPSGTALADFSLPLLNGGSMTLSEWKGKSVALIFMNPQCRFCAELLPKLSARFPDLADAQPALVIISRGSVEENRRFFSDYPVSCPVVLQKDSELAALYHANATPMAILVGPDGTTIGNPRVGAEPVLQLFQPEAASDGHAASTNGSHATDGYSRLSTSVPGSRLIRDGLKKGTVAPEFTLPSIGGSEISLRDYRGRQVLLVFSSPTCGPCLQLAPKLEERRRAVADCEILMISKGEVEENQKKAQQYGLTFPIVLQRHWEISRAYGMFATPMGYLVNSDGILDSDAAVGVESVLGLLSVGKAVVQRALRH